MQSAYAAESDIADALPQLTNNALKSFNYKCTLAGAVWNASNCLKESKAYFNKLNLTSEIVPTTTILLFYMRFNNSLSYNMSADCIRALNAQFVILSTATGGKLPLRRNEPSRKHRFPSIPVSA